MYTKFISLSIHYYPKINVLNLLTFYILKSNVKVTKFSDLKHHRDLKSPFIVFILNFTSICRIWCSIKFYHHEPNITTNMSEKTVLSLIRLLPSSNMIRDCTVCHCLCRFFIHFL